MDKVDVRFPKAAPKSAPVKLPGNAEERAAALVELMNRLAAHLRRESAALRARRPAAEMAALLREKHKLVMVYEEVSRLLRLDREGMTSLPAALKGDLRDAARALAEGAAENAETLRVNGDTQKLLVDTIVGAVNRARSIPHVSYGPNATAPAGRGFMAPVSGPATAATLNTRL